MNTSPSSYSSTPALLNSAIQRLASQSATCKLISAVLAAAALLFAAGRSGGEILLWAAAPALLLALTDASYTSKALDIAKAASRFDGNKDALHANEIMQLQVQTGGIIGAWKALSGVLSFSVWPFYGSLAVLVIGLGSTVLAPNPKTAPFPAAAPFSQQMAFAPSQGQLRTSTPPNPNAGNTPAAFPATPNLIPRTTPPTSSGAQTTPPSGFPNRFPTASPPPAPSGPSFPKPPGAATVSGQPPVRPAGATPTTATAPAVSPSPPQIPVTETPKGSGDSKSK